MIKTRTKAIIVFIFIYLGLGFIPSQSQGCVTPVYRFALEEWFNDNYRVTVFYQKDMLSMYEHLLEPLVSSADKFYGQWPEELNLTADGEKGHANISIRFVDVQQPMTSSVKQLWEAQRDSEVPWVVIRYPASSRLVHSLWSGPLSDFKLAELFVDSPARQRICKRLKAGETAVWFIMKTSDEKKNRKTIKTIKDGLELSKKQLKLPEAVYNEDENTLSGTTAHLWRISFEIMSTSREDEDEIPFITMMLKSQPELMKYLREPIAFVLYGRCRTLKGIPASRLTEEVVVKTNKFLLDSCQCEIKDQNPGTDMLIRHDWTEFEKKIAEIKRKEISLRGITDFVAMESDSEELTDDFDNETSSSNTENSNANPSTGSVASLQIKHVVFLVLVLAIASLAVAFYTIRKKSA